MRDAPKATVGLSEPLLAPSLLPHCPHCVACAPCCHQSLLVDLSVIGRVNVVRKNVDATIRLLDKFRSLPEQCDELLDELYEHDRHIKKVYVQLRKLMLLRDTAFDPTIAASFSSDFTHKLTDTFSHLTDTADELELRVFENIGDWSHHTLTHTDTAYHTGAGLTLLCCACTSVAVSVLCWRRRIPPL